jgi:hypothetical protein
MTKRKFIGLGRKRKSSRSSGAEVPEQKKKEWELPDNFIFGFTNQHPNKVKTEPKKKVNSEE